MEGESRPSRAERKLRIQQVRGERLRGKSHAGGRQRRKCLIVCKYTDPAEKQKCRMIGSTAGSNLGWQGG